MKRILDTNLVKIIDHDGKLTNGGWIQMEPIPGGLEAQIAMLTLAIDCLAGKVYPQKPAFGLPDESSQSDTKQWGTVIEHKITLLTDGKKPNG